jgi:hypothetical protein
VLAGIVIFNVTGVANRGKSSACVTDKQTVQTAVDAYYNDHNSTYPVSGGNVNEALFRSSNYSHSQPPETFAIDTSNGTISGC